MKWKNLEYSTTYFITATITEWQPLLARPAVRDILLKDLEFYRKKYSCKIIAYVIMPEHYHIIVEFQYANDLHKWLHDMQSHTANEIAKWLRQMDCLNEFDIYSKHANGSSKLAIWKEQARALGIVSKNVLMTKIGYIHSNPVSRKLVDEPSQWLWSSWRNYHLDDDSIFKVDKMDFYS